MSLVQLFNRQKQEYKEFKRINNDHRQAHVNAVWAYSIFFPIVEFLSSMSIALMLVWVSMSVQGLTELQIRANFNEVVSFTLWVYMLYRPVRQMADKFNVLQRGTVRAERVFEIIDLEDNIQNEGSLTTCDFSHEISFKNVYFRMVARGTSY